MFRRTLLPIPFAALLTLAACGSHSVNPTPSQPAAAVSAQDSLATATPIKHVVVIFGENVSFDHYSQPIRKRQIQSASRDSRLPRARRRSTI
jgi:phospholipase C